MFKLVSGGTPQNHETKDISFKFYEDTENPSVVIQETTRYEMKDGVLYPKHTDYNFLLKQENNWQTGKLIASTKTYAYQNIKFSEREITLIFPFGITSKTIRVSECHLMRQAYETTGTIEDTMFILIPKYNLSKIEQFFLKEAYSKGDKTSKDVWKRTDAIVHFA